jgi:alkylation response protein AidB-like acyl-CoA dehydrogenase
MKISLTEEQAARRAEFRAFVDAEIAPHADLHDREERLSEDVIRKMAAQGYLGATVPAAYGGQVMDAITFGLLNEEIGRGCTAARGLITVQSMATRVIDRWGSDAQKTRWLRELATGQKIGAFALTEPEHGCDAANIEATAEQTDGGFVINGRKRWISYGQIADVFLVFAQTEKRVSAFLVERDTPGLTVEPMKGLLGARGSMLAELRFEDCRVAAENLVARLGFGLVPVGFTALDVGRYSIAWGAVGLAQACLDSSIQYTKRRKQFGVRLRDHQLIKRMITDMMTDITAARLMCCQAGVLSETDDRDSLNNMCMAKYHATNMAVRVTNAAVQMHGANGYSRDYPVERFYRDAKIGQMIEGSNEMLQLMISRYGYKK